MPLHRERLGSILLVGAALTWPAFLPFACGGELDASTDAGQDGRGGGEGGTSADGPRLLDAPTDGPADSTAEGAADASLDALVGAPSDSPGDAAPDGPADAGPDGVADALAEARTEGGVLDGLQNLANWSGFDTSTLTANAGGYVGAIFDGRYTYFVPDTMAYNTANGTVVRYDTTASFASTHAWSSFDTTTVNARAWGFAGGAFDGRFMYLSASAGLSVVTRYDTQGTFTDAASWSTYDAWGASDAGSYGHPGAIFDGRYVYFPSGGQNGGPPRVCRYDTTTSFTDPGSWTSFDLVGIDASAVGAYSGTFDGRYLYFAPNGGGNTIHALRYDSKAPFGASTSWVSFDIAPLTVGPLEFAGNMFDGRYVYYVPIGHSGSADSGSVVRYDTQASFTAPAAWSVFDATSIDAKALGFAGGGFDGRYVYFIPFETTHLARYDTQAPFGSASSWATFDVTAVDAKAQYFWGCAFDGQALYLAPFTSSSTQNTRVLRFEAKTPPSLPSTYHGSFF